MVFPDVLSVMEEYLIPDEYTLPPTGISQVPSKTHRWSASSVWKDHKNKIIGGIVGVAAVAGIAIAGGVAVRTKRARARNMAWNGYAAENYPVWDILYDDQGVRPSWGNDDEWDETNMDRAYNELRYDERRQPRPIAGFPDANDIREHMHANDLLDELDDEMYTPRWSKKQRRV